MSLQAHHCPWEKIVVDVLVVQLFSLVFETHAPLWSQAPLCCVKFPAGLWPHTNNNKKEKDKLISATEGGFVLVVEVAFPFFLYIYICIDIIVKLN